MKKKILINILLSLLIAVILFHLAVIIKAISYDILWGGRIQHDSAMYFFEVISILINLFLGLTLLMKGEYLKFRFKKKAIDVILWIFLAYFMLNTIGNLFAKTNFEKTFAILTFVFAAFIWLILKPGKISDVANPKQTK